MKIWTAVLESNLNPVKMKIWQDYLEVLLLKLLTTAGENNCNQIFDSMIEFEVAIVRARHVS